MIMEIFHFKNCGIPVPMVSWVLMKEVVMQLRGKVDPVPVGLKYKLETVVSNNIYNFNIWPIVRFFKPYVLKTPLYRS